MEKRKKTLIATFDSSSFQHLSWPQSASQALIDLLIKWLKRNQWYFSQSLISSNWYYLNVCIPSEQLMSSHSCQFFLNFSMYPPRVFTLFSGALFWFITWLKLFKKTEKIEVLYSIKTGKIFCRHKDNSKVSVCGVEREV